ncbi:MAG TPA: PEP-CTERM sorting domain-containing protein [Rhodocyclaceae bacterium]|nr:PEP-CTERM sorting domain-containing protein [Rhodocyclaceae bacterium]
MRNWLVALAATPLLFAASNNAQADFSGAYAIANWALSTSHGGSIDTSGVPASVTLKGGSDGLGFSNQTMQISSPGAGAALFHWSYIQDDRDASVWDPFGYLLNGSFQKLTVDYSGPSGNAQSGDASVMLAIGDIFAFDQRSLDSKLGFATTTISNFSGPEGVQQGTNVPEPATLALLGLSILSLAASRKRKK